MALFDKLREPSLSFVSRGTQYTLESPWTLELALGLPGAPLTIRTLLGAAQWAEFRKTGKSRKAAEQLTKDSLATMGIAGEHLYEFLAVANDDALLPYLERDLGFPLEDLMDGTVTLRYVISIFSALPDDCSFRRKLSEPESRWSRSEWMLADMVDLLNRILQMSMHQTAVNYKMEKIKEPRPYYMRPEKPKEVRITPTADFIGMLKGGTFGKSKL